MENKGFTLIEMILYISLSAVILFVISMFLMSLLTARTKNQSIAVVDQEGNKAMSIITQTIRNANSLVSVSSGTLELASGTGVDTIFTLSNGVITMNENGTVTPLTSSLVKISNLNFRNLSSATAKNNVDVSFTVTRVGN